jgi:uncharacterized ferritin-like protein (DUF455 family)
VSKDPPAKHAKFAAKHGLTAPLATDVDRGLSDALGVWGEKSLYGRLFMGMHRTTYLIDAEGRIARVWRKVKVKGHAAEVFEAAQGAVTPVAAAIRAALLTGDPRGKVMATRALARAWRRSALAWDFAAEMPERPAWPAGLELLPPNRMPSARSRRIAAQCDRAVAFAGAHRVRRDRSGARHGRPIRSANGTGLRRRFLGCRRRRGDAFRADRAEAAHARRALRRAPRARRPVGKRRTGPRHDVAARLAVVPMVLEARGLDVTPGARDRVHALGDAHGARILQRILDDEIRHVAAGTKHFVAVCHAHGEIPEVHWKMLVKRHFSRVAQTAIQRLSASHSRSIAGILRRCCVVNLLPLTTPINETAGGSDHLQQ